MLTQIALHTLLVIFNEYAFIRFLFIFFNCEVIFYFKIY